MLKYCYVVKGIGGVAFRQAFHVDLQKVALLKSKIAVVDAGDGISYAVSGDIGQETQATGVDTHHGDALISHAGCSAQERAVTAYADDCIGREIIALKQSVIRYVQAHGAGQELVVGTVNGYAVIECAEQVKELLLVTAEFIT